ncbi:MAG: 50S ribosomal protein L6 [Fermentimonas sp.]|nr:50S ribosomal protein L6 [Fermentimonas sp.]
MSRIGKLPINVPAGVTVTVGKDNTVTVKGPKGELTQNIDGRMKIEINNGELTITRSDESKESRSLHGLYRSLLNNMVIGVSEGFRKEMELVGVGYRVSNNGQIVEFSLGYTHSIFMELPKEIKVETKMERNKNPLIMLESCDKQLLGQVCAKIRSFRKPEPYKGKGIRFVGEQVRRKSGKTAAK